VVRIAEDADTTGPDHIKLGNVMFVKDVFAPQLDGPPVVVGDPGDVRVRNRERGLGLRRIREFGQLGAG
jgi:hypothetical protein